MFKSFDEDLISYIFKLSFQEHFKLQPFFFFFFFISNEDEDDQLRCQTSIYKKKT